MTQSTHSVPSPTSVEVGDRNFTIGRMKAVKAARLIGELRAISRETPQVMDDIAAFTRQYEEKNTRVISELQARIMFPPVPITIGGEIQTDENGNPHFRPSPADAISAERWAEGGGTLREAVSPSDTEVFLAMFDSVFERAERRVYRVVALMTLSNEEVVEAWHTGPEEMDRVIDERADLLLDECFIEDLFEVGLTAWEQIVAQVQSRPDLGRRLGKIVKANPTLEKLWGRLQVAMRTSSPDSSKPTGVTGSESNTDGTPEPSSTSPLTSSSTSDSGSTETTKTDAKRSGKRGTKARTSTSPAATTPDSE